MNVSPSHAFLRDFASKVFVCMSYQAIMPGESPQRLFASCFVVDIEGHWFLVTAGHVLTEINEAITRGASVSDCYLHDRLAGNTYEFAVPLPFDAERWVVIHGDPGGTDYAACLLPDLIAANLHQGGVRAVDERAWGPEPFDQYSPWLLVGIPTETYLKTGNVTTLNLTVIPLAQSGPPTSTLEPSPPNRTFARIVSQPGIDSATVQDITGMSGGPVFGLKIEPNGLAYHYWIIGIQSSWWASSRIVSFCPAAVFFDGIKQAVQAIEVKLRQAER